MSATILAWSLALAQMMLAAAMACAAIRLVRGPRAQDRILGLDALYVNAMLLLLTFGIRTGSTLYFEMALAIALLDQDRAAPQAECVPGTRTRRRIGNLQLREVLRHVSQVFVCLKGEQRRHLIVNTPSVTKAAQLLQQIAGRLASNARIVSVCRCPALIPVTDRASRGALVHVRRQRAMSGACQSHQAGDSE